MAFKDTDGKITIDELAASRDINCIRAARSHYEAADELLVRMLAMSEDFSGESAEAVRNIVARLKAQLDLMIQTSEAAENAVLAVVSKYQALDAQIKESFISSASGRR